MERISREGNSLFRFYVLISVLSLGVSFLVTALAIVLALPDIRAWNFGPGATAALVVSVPIFLAMGLTMAVVQVFLKDFVVPIMYLRRQSTMESWREFHRELLWGRKGTFTLYLLFKVVIAIVVGLLGFAMFCMSCCLATIPYLGAVIMLPLTVFNRAYSLSFLEQFGPDWWVFAPEGKPSEPVDDMDFA